ncbi:MAG: M28 family metallopeptidase, partial [Armatimonadota bacterium]
MSRIQRHALVALMFLFVSCGCDRQPYSESRSRPIADQLPVHLPQSVDTQRALEVIKYLSHDIGPRQQGSDNEYLAGDYIAESLRRAGCRVSIQSIELPNGRSSRNIIGFTDGRDGAQQRIVIGAHYDSKPRSAGANDNASGIAVVLELARLIPKHTLPFDLVFIGFGAEEIVDGNSNHHHYGSRQYVQSMSKEDLQKIIAM